MCSIDAEMADFYKSKLVKARKNYYCAECNRVIKSKEIYQYVVGNWARDNKLSVFKTCQHCLIAQAWLSKECGVFLHGGLEAEMEEHAEEYRSMFLYRLLIGIKRQWRKFQSNELMPLFKPTIS